MKPITKLLLLAPLLAACSTTVSNETTTLQPLPTTINILDTDVILALNGAPYAAQEFAFFDDVTFFYGSGTDSSDETLLEFGVVWCQLMIGGMTDTDVVARIYEGAIDDADAKMHFAVVLAAIDNLCPSQSDKSEYIALNTPVL